MNRRLWKEQYRDRSGQALSQAQRTYYLYSDQGLLAEATQNITLNADQSVTASGTAQISAQYGLNPDALWGTGPLLIKTKNSNDEDTIAYYHHDHLQTPVQATDTSGNIVWAASYDAFGRATITTPQATADKPTISSNLRLPGQYDDSETGLHYNWNRYYDPETGRYITSDPIGLAGGLNTYAYVYNNPIMYYDPYGLWAFGDPLPQGVVDFSAGFGDTISFGLTDWIRDQMDTNGAVNKCSNGYGAGEWAGIAYGFAAGGAAGWRAAGQKAAGKEFSHWIPNRMGGPRSKWNGNYVTPGRHYKHDPYRYPRRSQRSGDKWPAAIQQLDRIPNVYKGAAAGGGAASASAASNGCECQ